MTGVTGFGNLGVVVAFVAMTLLLGYALWTLIEYGAHRVLHTGPFRVRHWKHHLEPEDPAGQASWVEALVGAVVIGGTLTLAFGGYGFSTFLGVVVGYVMYLDVHATIHGHRDLSPAMERLRARHFVHHEAGVEKNFGVPTAIWDRVFGTEQAP